MGEKFIVFYWVCLRDMHIQSHIMGDHMYALFFKPRPVKNRCHVQFNGQLVQSVEPPGWWLLSQLWQSMCILVVRDSIPLAASCSMFLKAKDLVQDPAKLLTGSWGLTFKLGQCWIWPVLDHSGYLMKSGLNHGPIPDSMCSTSQSTQVLTKLYVYALFVSVYATLVPQKFSRGNVI